MSREHSSTLWFETEIKCDETTGHILSIRVKFCIVVSTSLDTPNIGAGYYQNLIVNDMLDVTQRKVFTWDKAASVAGPVRFNSTVRRAFIEIVAYVDKSINTKLSLKRK